jgi:hypothetical protein
MGFVNYNWDNGSLKVVNQENGDLANANYNSKN